MCRRIVCAADKAEVVRYLLSKTSAGCSVMCGDSLSDLQALLAVDFGIVIGKSSSLRTVLRAAGISLQPLSQGVLLVQATPATGLHPCPENEGKGKSRF